MSNKAIVMKDNEEKEVEIISIFRIPEYGKEYVLYTFGEKQKDNIKILASTLVREEDGYRFEKIATEAEWTAIKEIIRDLSKKTE